MPDVNRISCHSGFAGPTCIYDPAARLAADQKKVFILHDEADNSTIARLQTVRLAAELQEMDFIAYYKNGPLAMIDDDESRSGSGMDSDDIGNYKRSWIGKTKADQDNSLNALRTMITRKGPFYGLLALGQSSRIGRAVAAEHQLPVIPLEDFPRRYDSTRKPSSRSTSPSNASYPVVFVTSQKAYSFHTTPPSDQDPDSPDADADIPLPLSTIISETSFAVSSHIKMFDFRRPTVEELKARKAEKKAAEVSYAEARHREKQERRELVERMKERGEDPRDLPPSPLKARRALDFGLIDHTLRPSRKKEPDRTNEAASSSRVSRPGTTNKVSNYLLAPTADPVVPCSVESLTPMIEWLNLDEDIKHTEEPRIDFTRGSILGKSTPGGGTSVDLCKQVVGKDGIKPILDAVANNRHIDRFLLGNNIVTDEGAKVIADFILDERSKRVYNFYIAGNAITHVGIQYITNALSNNQNVTALWLKRNNLGSMGASHLGQMLAVNTRLEVLDLVNTNIGDTGAQFIFDGLTKNEFSALQHLYFGSSHHGVPTARYTAEYLKTGQSKLKSLYMGMSRLGNEGAEALAEGLAIDDKIERLGLSSCRIETQGAKALADALKGKKNLVLLDLGWRIGTYELGERGNEIGDEGAMYLGSQLLANPDNHIRILDLAKNGMTHDGVGRFVQEYIVPSKEISSINLAQSGSTRNSQAESTAKDICMKNKRSFFANQKQLGEFERIKDAIDPLHIREIYSIYRGAM